jgi:hypothetical protein
MKHHATKALCAAIVASAPGCAKTDSPTYHFDAAAIVQAATTLAVQSRHWTSQPELWPKGLVQPEPIRFYSDRVNLVIVLTAQPETPEAGLYVYLPHSSYYPRSDSEWKFQLLSAGVYKYERKR